MTDARTKLKADDLVLKINAPAFVPGSSSNHSKGSITPLSVAQQKSGSGLAVKAAPFVPGGRQGSSGTGSAVPESNALSRPGTVNAAPFVPNAGVAGSSIPGAVPAAAPTNNRAHPASARGSPSVSRAAAAAAAAAAHQAPVPIVQHHSPPAPPPPHHPHHPPGKAGAHPPPSASKQQGAGRNGGSAVSPPTHGFATATQTPEPAAPSAPVAVRGQSAGAARGKAAAAAQSQAAVGGASQYATSNGSSTTAPSPSSAAGSYQHQQQQHHQHNSNAHSPRHAVQQQQQAAMQRQQQQHMMDSAQMHHMGMGMTHMGSNNNLYGMGGQIMAAAGGGGGGRMSGYASGLPQQQQQQQGGHSARGHSASHQYHASGGGGGLRGNSGAGGRGLEPSSAGRVAMGSFFMEEGFKVQMQQRRYLALARTNNEGEDGGLPVKVGAYHTLSPLEPITAEGDQQSSALGLRTLVIKGVNAFDGQAYALRRIDCQQVLPSPELLNQAEEVVDAWSSLAHHPNLVALSTAFISSELDGSPALFFAHDYHPGAVTLTKAHLSPSSTASGLTVTQQVPEETIWSILLQLTAALRVVHTAGLALRPAGLHPTKVLLTGCGRVRAGCVGVLDVLSGDLHAEFEDLSFLHRQDLSALGQLLLTLSCFGLSTLPSLDVASSHRSHDLVRVTAALLASSDGGGLGSWRQLAGVLADRSLMEMEATMAVGDALVEELGKECENGRLMRLMVKLDQIHNRTEEDMDPSWSGTGDRHLLSLFRTFVFHQTSEEGGPQLDWGHVVETLNKLDAGVSEQILLMSADEQSMVVVSYADIRTCLDSAYAELRAKAAPANKGGAASPVMRQALKGRSGAQ